MAEIKDLIGKILKKVSNIENKEIIFETFTGEKYKLYHKDGHIEYISGNINHLEKNQIIESMEIKNTKNSILEPGIFHVRFPYRFKSKKGTVDIGFYSESKYSDNIDSMSFEKIE